MLLLLVEAVILTTVTSSSEVEVGETNFKEDSHQSHEEAVFTLEASIQATIILTIAIIIIILNTLIITSFSNFRGKYVQKLTIFGFYKINVFLFYYHNVQLNE